MSKRKDEDQIRLNLSLLDGAIIFRSEEQQEYFIAPLDDDERSQDIRASIAFFIYASQNQKWVEEFNTNMVKSYEEEIKKQKKSHLKVIK
tara:strand:- start:149 stop:418 length:270 start_codon:yes stop_codon:yes gene_type:complete